MPDNQNMQCNVAITITGAIKVTSQTKLNQELRVESLPFRRWLSRIFALFKIKSSSLTKYLLDLIPQENQPHNTCSGAIISIFYWRTDLRKHSVFHFAINEWNKPNFKTCNTESLVSFRKTLLRIGQPFLKSVFNVHNPTGLKLLTRLRLGLSNFDSHRFPDNFSFCVNPLWFCSLELESLPHFFCTANFLQTSVQPS